MTNMVAKSLFSTNVENRYVYCYLSNMEYKAIQSHLRARGNSHEEVSLFCSKVVSRKCQKMVSAFRVRGGSVGSVIDTILLRYISIFISISVNFNDFTSFYKRFKIRTMKYVCSVKNNKGSVIVLIVFKPSSYSWQSSLFPERFSHVKTALSMVHSRLWYVTQKIQKASSMPRAVLRIWLMMARCVLLMVSKKTSTCAEVFVRTWTVWSVLQTGQLQDGGSMFRFVFTEEFLQ